MLTLLLPYALAGDITVSPGSSIQDALNQAVAGDTIIIQAGTYSEELVTVVDGTETAPITLKAADGEEVIITTSGEVMQLEHAWIHVDGIIFDGQYGNKDTLDIRSGANNLLLTGIEVRHSNRDCIDIKGPANVTIDNATIHHCLQWDGERADAHGIVAGNAANLTISNTEIHTFSGDGIQIDPDRLAPAWDNLLIEDCHIWLAPLAQETNGFPAGSVPGENAFDSKTWDDSTERAKVTFRRIVAHGFRNGFISNMSVFNIKESVDVLVDKVIVYDSEIAFRLRGPGRDIGAAATIMNSVVYDVDFAFRYEDNIETINIWNVTLGNDVLTAFKEASSDETAPDVRNLLVLAAELPSEAQHSSNLAVESSAFVDAGNHDYHLVAGTQAIDNGEAISQVSDDMDGQARPFGAGYDIGAYEYFTIDDTDDTEDTGVEETATETTTDTDTSTEESGPDDSNDQEQAASSDDSEPDKANEGSGACSVGALQPGFALLWLSLIAWRRQRRAH